MSRLSPTLLSIAFLLTSCSGQSLVSLANTHVHGMAVDGSTSLTTGRLYIATHHGLLALSNDALTHVGRSRDDFMGFSAHPTDPKILFSSGHPKGGGNIGVQRSEDGGVSWRKISDGYAKGPADFHAMLVHPANPNNIYGWYRLRIQRSEDGGRSWEQLAGAPPEILSFEGHSKDDRILYAGTVAGLLVSRDRGETWESVSAELATDAVFDIEIDPRSPDIFTLATVDHGIVRLTPALAGGMTLERLGQLPNGDITEYLALDPKQPETLYAFGKGHVLYKSEDGGKAWRKVL